MALWWEPGTQGSSATQGPSSSPGSKEQTRVKHSVRQTQVWPEQWDRAKRGTRRAATPSRKWERAPRSDNLDQGEHVLWFGAGVAPRCPSEIRPYGPKLQRRARSGWHRDGAVAAGPQRGDGWLRRTNILKQADRKLPYLSKHVGGPPSAQPWECQRRQGRGRQRGPPGAQPNWGPRRHLICGNMFDGQSAPVGNVALWASHEIP